MKRRLHTPLLNALIKNKKRGTIPFHMPGHKKGKGLAAPFVNVMRHSPFDLDLTEIPGLDDLHHPTGVIREAQQQAAELFGSEATHFLVNGTTVGIHASIMTVCKPGEEIILPRDVHRSAVGACILSGARPVYLSTKLETVHMIPCPSSPQELSGLLVEKPHAKAVFQTYPSYYGLAGNLTEMADLAHQRGLPLLVDEAHGAHFNFSERLPKTALESKADITVQSTHKVLGALTQASMLHIKSQIIDGTQVAGYLQLLQTTSPSYLLMASLDAAAGHMKQSGSQLMERTLTIAEEARKRISQIKGLKCLDESILGQNNIFALDPTKLLISAVDLGLTGYQLDEILRKDYGIQVELSDRYNILCMITLGSTRDDCKRLIKGLEDISGKRLPSAKPLSPDHIVDTLPLPKVAITPREAWIGKRRKIPLNEAKGMISAEIIAPYPPGIPVLCPGEEITEEVLAVITYFKRHGHAFHGASDSELVTIEITDY